MHSPRSRRARAIAWAMVVCFGLTPVTGRAAEPAERFDLGGLEPLAAESRASLGEALLAAAMVACDERGFPAEKLTVSVRWRDADTFDYLIVVVLDAHAGTPASRQVGSTGPDARQPDLVELAAATLERAFAERTLHEPDVAPAPVVPPVTPPVRPVAVAPPPLRKVQLAGIGVMFGGLPFAGVGPFYLSAGLENRQYDAVPPRTARGLGAGLVVVAAVMLTGGALMLALGERRRGTGARARHGAGRVGSHLRQVFAAEFSFASHR